MLSLLNATPTAPPAAAPAPRSPWPEHPSASSAQPATGSSGDGVTLGAAGKLLGFIMDMPRPTHNKMLSPEQITEIKQTLQPGDVLLETNDNYPGWQVNAKLVLKSDWVHAAIYVGNNTIIDSTTERHGVNKISVEDFGKCHHLAVIRPNYKTDADKQAALDYAEKSIGIPYDFDWRLDNNTLYCTRIRGQRIEGRSEPDQRAAQARHGSGYGEPAGLLADARIEDRLDHRLELLQESLPALTTVRRPGRHRRRGRTGRRGPGRRPAPRDHTRRSSRRGLLRRLDVAHLPSAQARINHLRTTALSADASTPAMT